MTKYVNIINRYKNDFRTGKSVSVKNYHEEIEAVSYLDYIDVDDLKELRNKYLHWSVKSDQIGLDPQRNRNAPNTNEALTAKYRKRHIQNG